MKLIERLIRGLEVANNYEVLIEAVDGVFMVGPDIVDKMSLPDHNTMLSFGWFETEDGSWGLIL